MTQQFDNPILSERLETDYILSGTQQLIDEITMVISATTNQIKDHAGLRNAADASFDIASVVKGLTETVCEEVLSYYPKQLSLMPFQTSVFTNEDGSI